MNSVQLSLRTLSESLTGEVKFSIVIPCHDESRYVTRLLDSLENQTFPISMFEVIVVDNGSSDNMSEVIWSFAENTSLQLHFLHEYKLGVSRARNSGAKSSIGETIIFLDGDNLVEPHFLDNLSECMATKGCVAGTFRTLPDSPTWKGSFVFWALELIKCLIPRPFGKSFVRRDIFNHVNGFGDNIVLGENAEFLSRVKSLVKVNSEKFSHINKPIFCSLRRFEKEGYIAVLFPWLLSYLGVKGLYYRTMSSIVRSKE
jgi:glycosyltransferase involved in cell wall biosynthesis